MFESVLLYIKYLVCLNNLQLCYYFTAISRIAIAALTAAAESIVDDCDCQLLLLIAIVIDHKIGTHYHHRYAMR